MPESRALPDLAAAALSRDGSALGLGGAVAAAGAVAAVAARSGGGRQAARLLLAAGAGLSVGGLRARARRRETLRRFPPPGLLVDVGGFRMHVLAEGDLAGGPAVVWFPGAHAAGYALHHLHRAWSGEGRSVLVDRPGTGWSDAGPFPRTTAREVDEVLAALVAAGEEPPYVLVGHSFGGLLAANIARRHPDLVHALVLLDPTPADTVVYAPRVEALRGMRRAEVRRALRLLVGMQGYDQQRTAAAMSPALGDAAAAALVALEDRPASALATASIFRELSPAGFARAGWDTVVYDGDLGDLPVYLVSPPDMRDDEWAMVAAAAPDEPERLRRFYARTRERYLASSTRTERVLMPAGSGHNFPATLPDAVLGVVRRALSQQEEARRAH